MSCLLQPAAVARLFVHVLKLASDAAAYGPIEGVIEENYILDSSYVRGGRFHW